MTHHPSGPDTPAAGGSPAAPVRSRSRAWAHARGARLLPVLVGSLATALYCALSWSQWIRWDVPSWDNAIFTQLLSSYASGRGPVVDLKGHGFDLLGDHFHPLLIVLAPLYRVFPSALTPMLAQDVLFGISAAVVTRCAARVLHPAPALALGAAYALSFGLQNAVAVQFHEIALAVPLLAAGLCALRERRWVAAALWSAPVALVKEDLGITVAAIGALALGHAARPGLHRGLPAVRRRWAGFLSPPPRSPGERAPGSAAAASSPRGTARDAGRGPRRRHPGKVLRDPALLCGAVLVVWGVLVSALAVGVILPALNPSGEFAYADKLDVAGLLRDPASAVILQVVPARKLVTWSLLLLSGAVVAVRSPIALAALPTLVWRMLSPNDGYWGPGWHYSAVLMPVLFVALVDAVARLRGDAARAGWRWDAGRGGRDPAGGLDRDAAAREEDPATAWSPGRSPGTEATVLRAMAAAAPWAALLVGLLLSAQLPLAQLAGASAWQQDPRHAAKAAAVAEVPRGASVASDLSLMNALVSRARVHWIGSTGDPAPEYVVVDRSSGTWGDAPPQDVADYARDVYGREYTVVSDEQNIVVARLRS
ncbi:DUF2079 domain-containing protein [Kocuria tytonis]|uniref:DUF2079 domain-containing protein n=1 Tax=Kocuria tytonis TaxID=2054280 RepID=A0A495AAB7_9MICC|nr:DUF2079 domain-containing protein [Kocuria tytonis]RKQ36979.1 DUF2079 domain-containing protein [Kocuria tytonis]